MDKKEDASAEIIQKSKTIETNNCHMRQISGQFIESIKMLGKDADPQTSNQHSLVCGKIGNNKG